MERVKYKEHRNKIQDKTNKSTTFATEERMWWHSSWRTNWEKVPGCSNLNYTTTSTDVKCIILMACNSVVYKESHHDAIMSNHELKSQSQSENVLIQIKELTVYDPVLSLAIVPELIST